MIGITRKLLLIPHIKIHNANALSSSYTIGFPAMTAWLGAAHALQRQLNEKGFNLKFDATAVISHRCDVQTFRGNGDFVSSIIGTANPLDKTGSRSAFIEEARCHLDVSLLIEVNQLGADDEADFLEATAHLLNAKMKISGGDIKTFDTPEIMLSETGNEKDRATIIRKLMPGYAIVERRELMLEGQAQGKDATDALLDYLAIYHHCELDENDNVIWHSHRLAYQDRPAGWIVPIATGFQGISDLATVKNQRSQDTPHRFAESIVTLGEFRMPYRFDNIEDMFWRYHYDKANSLYLCQQAQFSNSAQSPSSSNEFE